MYIIIMRYTSKDKSINLSRGRGVALSSQCHFPDNMVYWCVHVCLSLKINIHGLSGFKVGHGIEPFYVRIYRTARNIGENFVWR